MERRKVPEYERAYSHFEIRSTNEERREIEGVATTPATDSYGDIVEPKGALFKLPLPFLYQHNHGAPIGHVVKASPTRDGIDVAVKLAKIDEPGLLKDRLDLAWQEIKLKLVRGLSIGFRPVDYKFIDGGDGVHFIKWAWLELSAVTIPANHEATIEVIKHFDSRALAASGRKALRVARLEQPYCPERAERLRIRSIMAARGPLRIPQETPK